MRIFLLPPRALHPPPALPTSPHSPFSLLPLPPALTSFFISEPSSPSRRNKERRAFYT